MDKPQESQYWSDFVAWATDNLPSHGRDLSVENKEDWETYWACFYAGVEAEVAARDLPQDTDATEYSSLPTDKRRYLKETN